jgi:uncharacterized protein (DUF2147 family)
MSQTLPPYRLPATAISIAFSLGVVLSSGAPAFSETSPVTPEGIWLTKDGDSIVRIHPCSETQADASPAPSTPAASNTAASNKAQTAPAGAPYCGTVVWLKEPVDAHGKPKVDDLNSDPAKKNKPVIGLDILLGLTAQTDHWTGQAYNPDDGKYYDITFKVKTNTAPNDQADLRGCVLKILCQTETFTRAAEVPGGDPTLMVAAKPAKAHATKKENVVK